MTKTYGKNGNIKVNVFDSYEELSLAAADFVADKMKGAGYALAASGVIGFILNMIATVLEANGGFVLEMYMPETVPFLFGVFLIALAYVFNYGCKLQQESDETI